MTVSEKCGVSGGQGIGSGHTCICIAAKGHPPVYGRGHGCSCGAVWSDPAPAGETFEVRQARESIATASPEILAAAKTLVQRGDVWEELNVMRQFMYLWDARDAVSAAYNVTFSSENLARVVESTGLSLQSVAEVARELKAVR